MKYDPQTEAFKRQNRATWSTMTKDQKLHVSMDTDHHSGGLYVAGRYFDYPAGRSDGIFVKMHDSWGPDDPDLGPVVVVHLYDPEMSPQGDIVLYFKTGKAAADLYLNDEALVAIWKATR